MFILYFPECAYVRDRVYACNFVRKLLVIRCVSYERYVCMIEMRLFRNSVA